MWRSPQTRGHEDVHPLPRGDLRRDIGGAAGRNGMPDLSGCGRGELAGRPAAHRSSIASRPMRSTLKRCAITQRYGAHDGFRGDAAGISEARDAVTAP